MHLFIYEFMYVFIYQFMYGLMDACVCLYIYFVCTNVFMHLCTYVFIYLSIYVFMYGIRRIHECINGLAPALVPTYFRFLLKNHWFYNDFRA